MKDEGGGMRDEALRGGIARSRGSYDRSRLSKCRLSLEAEGRMMRIFLEESEILVGDLLNVLRKLRVRFQKDASACDFKAAGSTFPRQSQRRASPMRPRAFPQERKSSSSCLSQVRLALWRDVGRQASQFFRRQGGDGFFNFREAYETRLGRSPNKNNSARLTRDCANEGKRAGARFAIRVILAIRVVRYLD